ncbi:enoyl-CoA hydratase/isomerase family protein [Streptomyces graminofaciens]|uniref:enoyl-CoA hydratase/isomerase family protein n=1 Tax=Streptomyces graminofaciens TaxID=68212 RepID=UPI0033063AE4
MAAAQPPSAAQRPRCHPDRSPGQTDDRRRGRPRHGVIAVEGKGPSFCADGDFHQFLQLHDDGDNPVGFLTDVSACFSRIAAGPNPSTAVLQGHAVAGGLELALACDVIVAGDATVIGDGHLNRRPLPSAGRASGYPEAVGRGLSRWLLLTGELLPATAFEHTGWIRAIVPQADLDATATRICQRLADPHSPASPAQQRPMALLHRSGHRRRRHRAVRAHGHHRRGLRRTVPGDQRRGPGRGVRRPARAGRDLRGDRPPVFFAPLAPSWASRPPQRSRTCTRPSARSRTTRSRPSAPPRSSSA